MSLFYSKNDKSLLSDILKKNDLKKDFEQFNDQNVIAEFVIQKEKRNDFHMDKSSYSGGISTLICKICGNDKFVVGQAEFFTAIKCDRCGYELGIHEG